MMSSPNHRTTVSTARGGNDKDRRRCARRAITDWQLLTVDMAVPGAPKGGEQRAIVLNLSESGVAVQPFQPLSAEEFVELRFGLPGLPKPFNGKGIVAWAETGGPTGIQFLDTTTDVREQLRRWVANDLHLPSQLPPPLPDCAILSTGPQAQEFENGLRLIARRAMVVTRASGVAIALGDEQGMRCRASIGIAPDVGASVHPERGITGRCVTAASVIHCPDAHLDARVDVSAARRLQLGSILVVPILSGGKVAGIVEALSRNRNAFDKYHTSRLEAFAGLIGNVMEMASSAPDSRASELGSLPALADALSFVNTDARRPISGDASEDSNNPLECLWNLIENTIQPRRTGFIEPLPEEKENSGNGDAKILRARAAAAAKQSN